MNIFHNLLIKMKRILPYSILFIVLLLGVFVMHNIYASNALTGDDILSIGGNNLKQNKLIIEILRSYPPKGSSEYQYVKSDAARGSEHIFIFGDGVVFSERWVRKEKAADLAMLGFEIDDSWQNERKSYFRRIKYQLPSTKLTDLLAILGSYSGQLLPGESVADYTYQSEVRVIYDGQEGRLFETVGSRIENENNLEFIDSFIDHVRETEWGSDVEVPDQLSWLHDREAKMVEFGWFETQLKGNEWGNFKTAWDARGVEYDEALAR